uniref:Solute carrier family 13 member 3 n=1 Tax=Paramormyrops kingsleyae TaxID=1676925 RepID=A0A3B3RY52_9TELE
MAFAFGKKLWCVRKQLIIILTPFLLLPLIFALPAKEGKCLYVVLLMAVFWCTEALPLAVTALLPICLFPTLGVLPSKLVCPQYFLETNFLFLSGLVMASAIEEWNLHRRIALRVLKIVGVKPAWLVLGMMVTSSFLSMWLSNTATTAMMLPIANAILESLFGDLQTLKENCKLNREEEGLSPVKLQALTSEKEILTVEDRPDMRQKPEGQTLEEIRTESEYQLKVWKGFMICIPYAASIGGTATLTGTAPNLILAGQLKSYFPDCDVINFGSWFVFGFPLMLLFLVLGWIWISFLYGGLNTRLCVQKQDRRAEAEKQAKAIIDDDYKKLGSMKFSEGAILFFFILFAVLLFTRDPKFFQGWSVFFPKGYVSDAVTGVAIVSILFFFPSQKPSLKWWIDWHSPNTEYVPLLSWKKAQDCVPWNIILLLGGGFAMAKACEAKHGQVNPLYFMVPATVSCSFAFMLPVSTPPNSIAFASGHLLVKDMVKTGFVMNILGVLTVSLAINTWGAHIFSLSTIPEWAHLLNTSDSVTDLHNLTQLLDSTVKTSQNFSTFSFL